MIQSITNLRELKPSDGFYLTDKNETIVSKVIYLGLADNPENYHEITAERAEEIAKQSKAPVEIDNSLEYKKARKLQELTKYDSSDEVNSFTYNGIKLWLDKGTRVGLVNAIAMLRKLNEEKITLILNETQVELDLDAAELLLASVEAYALKCYNITAKHKIAIEKITTEKELIKYNFKTDYPEKLTF